MIVWLGARFVLRRMILEWGRSALQVCGVALAVIIALGVVRAQSASVASSERVRAAFGDADAIELVSPRGAFSAVDVAALTAVLSYDLDVEALVTVPVWDAARGRTVQLYGARVAASELDQTSCARPQVLELGSQAGSPYERSLVIAGRAHVIRIVPRAAARHRGSSTWVAQGELLAECFGVRDAAHVIVVRRGQDAAKDSSKSLTDTVQQLVASSGVEARIAGRANDGAVAPAMSRAFNENVSILVITALILAALLIYQFAELSCQRVVDEVAALRTLGVNQRLIGALLCGEAVVVAGLGTVLGILLGWPLVELVYSLVVGTLQGLYGHERTIRELSVAEEAGGVALVALTALTCAVLGTLMPARRAAAAPPGLVARSSYGVETPRVAVSAKRAAMLLLLAAGLLLIGYFTERAIVVHGAVFSLMVFTFPLAHLAVNMVVSTLRRAARHFGLLPMLSAATIDADVRTSAFTLGLSASAVALLCGLGIMITSFRETLDGWIGAALAADIFVKSDDADGERPLGLSEGLVRSIVALAEPGRSTIVRAAQIERDALPVTVSFFPLHAALRGGRLQIVEGSERALSDAARRPLALISEQLARRGKYRLDQAIRIGDGDFVVAGVIRDFSVGRGVIFIDSAWIERSGLNPINHSVQIDLPSGHDQYQVIRRLHEGLRGEFVKMSDNRELRTIILQIFDETFLVTEFLRWVVIGLVGCGLFGALLHTVHARRRELRTLEVLGVARSQFRWLLLLESWGVAVGAVLIGVPVGVIIGAVLVLVVNPVSFGWSLEFAFSWREAFYPAVLLLASATVAALVGAERAGRITRRAALADE